MVKHKKKELGSLSDSLYRKYMVHMHDKGTRERWKIFADGVALSLPMLAAFSWYIHLIFATTAATDSGVSLSPGRTEPVIIFILVFVVAYGIFLMVEYNLLSKRLAKIEGKK